MHIQYHVNCQKVIPTYYAEESKDVFKHLLSNALDLQNKKKPSQFTAMIWRLSKIVILYFLIKKNKQIWTNPHS